MKRLNPQTNKFFKFGDIRQDGKRFKGYSRKIAKKTGFQYEEWISPEAFELAKKRNDTSARKFAKNNRPRVREIDSKYSKNNRGTCNAKNARYVTSKLQRTPNWLTEFDHIHIKALYQLAAMRTRESGFPWHVDHVIPLRGKNVSGLHTPSNMRVIPGEENVRKNNVYAVE